MAVNPAYILFAPTIYICLASLGMLQFTIVLNSLHTLSLKMRSVPALQPLAPGERQGGSWKSSCGNAAHPDHARSACQATPPLPAGSPAVRFRPAGAAAAPACCCFGGLLCCAAGPSIRCALRPMAPAAAAAARSAHGAGAKHGEDVWVGAAPCGCSCASTGSHCQSGVHSSSAASCCLRSDEAAAGAKRRRECRPLAECAARHLAGPGALKCARPLQQGRPPGAGRQKLDADAAGTAAAARRPLHRYSPNPTQLLLVALLLAVIVHRR